MGSSLGLLGQAVACWVICDCDTHVTPYYLENGNDGPQERVKVLAVALDTTFLVNLLATKLASEQIHTQDTEVMQG